MQGNIVLNRFRTSCKHGNIQYRFRTSCKQGNIQNRFRTSGKQEHILYSIYFGQHARKHTDFAQYARKYIDFAHHERELVGDSKLSYLLQLPLIANLFHKIYFIISFYTNFTLRCQLLASANSRLVISFQRLASANLWLAFSSQRKLNLLKRLAVSYQRKLNCWLAVPKYANLGPDCSSARCWRFAYRLGGVMEQGNLAVAVHKRLYSYIGILYSSDIYHNSTRAILTDDCKNVPVCGSLFRPKSTPYMTKYHTFLMTLSL